MNDQVSLWYDDFMDEQIRKGINSRHLNIIERIVKHGNPITVTKVLEIGCGIGTQSELLSKYFKKASILAVDISEKSITYAQAKYEDKNNLVFEVRNLVEEPLKDSFDLIVLADVIEHIPLNVHGRLFNNLEGMLTSNGCVCINIPSPNYLEYLNRTSPETLQIIDQPIFTLLLSDALKDSELYIHYLETYSIWINECDYQFIILRKKPISFHSNNFNERSFWNRTMSYYQRRIKHWF